jgi:uncharacterized protein with NRDE domain
MVKKGDLVYIPQNTRISVPKEFRSKMALPASTPEPLRGILVEMDDNLSTVYLAGELVTVKTADIKKWRHNGKADSSEKEFYPKFFPERVVG